MRCGMCSRDDSEFSGALIWKRIAGIDTPMCEDCAVEHAREFGGFGPNWHEKIEFVPKAEPDKTART